MNSPLVTRHSSLDHVSIRASAGSGKTYQLASRYLQLLAAGVEPGSILASTFTRLAAGEIRDRILLRLATAIDDADERERLRWELGAATLSRDALLDMLANLARRLDRLASGVRTLDSFFAAVVHAFAIELDIPIGAQVVDESQAIQMRSEAIRLMLDERQPQDLVDLLRLLTQGTSERGVTSIIDRTVKDLYGLYRESDETAWECVPQLDGHLPPPKLVTAINRLSDAECPGDSRWLAAHRKACEAARAWQWDAFLSAGLAKAIAAETNSYYKKPIPAPLIDAYRPVVRHARAELVARVRNQTIATRELLKVYHSHYEAVKHRRRAVTFDDLTAAMVQAQRLGKTDEIAYRLDAKLHHLLLDEFQDTSVTQWRALQRIAQEIVSCRPPQRTFFCVGDVKQSIYGWRDAAPEVLDELPRLLVGPDGESAITQRALSKSYRSSQIIIDVVNTVFESLRQNESVADFSQAVEAWLSGCDHHETEKRDRPGYAELRTAPRAQEGQDKNAIRYAMAADLATEIAAKNPHLSIAILTRTNDAVAALMYELGPTRRNIAGGVSGRGGVSLTNAPPVNAILDLLQLADHPDDTIAAFNIANSPLGEAVGLAQFDDRGARHRIARDVRRQLMEDGYGKTIARWVDLIAEFCDARELRRLLQLVEMATIHDQSAAANSLRTRAFIEMVETTSVADVQPAAVQVMTIHQSKGLEFDVVILPELDAELKSNRPPPVVVERDGGTGPITAICRYMNEKIRPFVPQLQPLFDRHCTRTVRESLSVLYVAMTRARHALHMIIDPPAENERTMPKTLAGVLRCALAQCEIEPSTILFQRGDANWIGRIPVQEREAVPPLAEPIPMKLAPSPGTRRRGLSATAASAIAEDQSTTLRHILALPNQEARDRGAALHALFEQIEWLEDFGLDDEQLLALVRVKVPRRDKRWARHQAQALRAALKQPAICESLSRGRAAPTTLRLLREHPFARLHNGGVQRGFIDRLVVNLNSDGSPCSAVVMDFKTDAVDAAGASALAEHYGAQMLVYREAAAEFLGLDEKAVAVRLVFVLAGAVMDL